MRNLVILLFLVVVGVYVARGIRATAVPAVGRTAPDFTLSDHRGSPVTLSEYRGKWVVLYLYPADAPTGSTVEIQNFRRDQSKYDAANAVVLGIYPKPLNTLRGADDETPTLKLLGDPLGNTTHSYGAVENYNAGNSAARSNFLIDPQGKIVSEWLGIDPNGHSTEALAKLASVQR